MKPALPDLRKLCSVLWLLLFLTACSTGAPPTFSPFESTLVKEALEITPFPSLTPFPTLTQTPQEFLTLAAEVEMEAQTPLPSSSLTPPAAPTAVPSPAPSLTPWPTQLPPPTLAPAVPQQASERYNLASWTVERADLMAALLQVERSQLSYDEAGNYAWDYFAAWKPVALAYLEAALRFPEEETVSEKRWAAAYALTQYGDDQQAGQIYAALLNEALNSRQISLENLPAWFRQRQRRYLPVTQPGVFTHLDLRSSALMLPGFSSAYLLNLQDSEQGGLCLLLLEKDGQYQTEVLFGSLMAWNEPRLSLKNIINCSPIDVDGDGWDEVLASRYEGGPLGATSLQIFSLDRLPAYPLPFGPDGSDVFRVGWGGYQGFERLDGRDLLKYSIVPSQGCSLAVSGRSRWNGEWFEPARLSFDFRSAGDALSACLEFIKDFASQVAPAAANDLLDGSIRHWFRRAEALEDPQKLDELRVLKGLYLAYEGRVDAARGVFAAISASPTITDSIWIEPSRSFLQTYQRPQDIYRACQLLDPCPSGARGEESACVETNPCSSHQALSALIQTMPEVSLPNAVGQLQMWGVPVQTSGYIDLDGDGLRESWFTIRHPGGRDPEVWAVAASGKPAGANRFLKALRFEGAPLPLDTLRRYDASGGGLILINGLRQYRFTRLDATGEPFLLTVPSYPDPDPAEVARASFEDLRAALYAGADPSLVLESLLQVEKWRRFQCDPRPEQPANGYCPDFLYTLGLAAELGGYSDFAIQYYHQLWRDYPASLYSVMARLKLLDAGSLD